MPLIPNLKTQPKTAAKPSVVEFAVLAGACPLAGVGAALTFANPFLGLTVAGVGLVAVGAYAVAAYGLAPDLVAGLRQRQFKLGGRHEDSRRLSVTEIAGRRREAPGRSSAPDEAADIAKMTKTAPVSPAADTERVVPLRMRALR